MKLDLIPHASYLMPPYGNDTSVTANAWRTRFFGVRMLTRSFQSAAGHIDIQQDDVRQKIASQLHRFLHGPSLPYDFENLVSTDDARQAFPK